MDYSKTLRYDMSGRKRKTKALNKARKLRMQQKGQTLQAITNVLYERSKQIHDAIPSKGLNIGQNGEGGECGLIDTEERKRISKQYTIAPAYNKGAYQVVPESDIKFIGRK